MEDRMGNLKDVAAGAQAPVNIGSLGITAEQFNAMPQAAKSALAKAAQAVRDAEARSERTPSVKLSDKGYFVVTGLPENPVVTFSPKGLAVILDGFAGTLAAQLAEHGEAQQQKLNTYKASPERAAVIANIKAERAERKAEEAQK